MSRKNRIRKSQPQNQGRGHGQPGSWLPPTPPPELPGGDLPHISIGEAINGNAAPTPPGGDNPSGPKSGYDHSRGNACKTGLRGRAVFPDEVAELIEERTAAFIAEMKPCDEWEMFLVSEIARASVLVEVAGRKLALDALRVYDRIRGDGWDVDMSRQIDRLIARLPREPLTVRELERSKQGTEFLLANLLLIGEVVESQNCLDDQQHEMLCILLGVPHALRNGTRRIPPATDGPGLAALIAKEAARLERNLVGKLIAQDRTDQNLAKVLGSPYQDKITRNLRSDEARNLKRLYWAKETLAQVRAGADAATIIDPETKSPIKPGANTARSAKPKPKPEPAPPPEPSPAPPPPPVQPEDDPPPGSPVDLPPLPEGISVEDRESLLLYGELVGRLRDMTRAQSEVFRRTAAGAQPEPGPPPPV